jgi:hypothetical protein
MLIIIIIIIISVLASMLDGTGGRKSPKKID